MATEHGVIPHRLAGVDVHEALRVEPGDLAFARDEGDGARNVVRVDMALHGIVNPTEALFGNPDRFGFDGCPGDGQGDKGEQTESQAGLQSHG
jgi:hypothetical protein